MTTPTPSPTHQFREVGYQLPRPHNPAPVVPDASLAGLFPKQAKK